MEVKLLSGTKAEVTFDRKETAILMVIRKLTDMTIEEAIEKTLTDMLDDIRNW